MVEWGHLRVKVHRYGVLRYGVVERRGLKWWNGVPSWASKFIDMGSFEGQSS